MLLRIVFAGFAFGFASFCHGQDDLEPFGDDSFGFGMAGPGSGPGGGAAGLCLSRGNRTRCGMVFPNKPVPNTCSGVSCDPSVPGACTPMQSVENHPQWSTMNVHEAVKTPEGQNGSVANYYPVRCTVVRNCGCRWDDYLSRYSCKASATYTTLNSYSKLIPVPNDPGCVGQPDF